MGILCEIYIMVCNKKRLTLKGLVFFKIKLILIVHY